MTKWKETGRSLRTPAKHKLINKTLGMVFGSAPFIRTINPVGRRVAIDFCAGDGIPDDESDFWNGCSPGILIKHASEPIRSGTVVPGVVDLWEINANTYASLIDQIAEHVGPPRPKTDDQSMTFRYEKDGRCPVWIRANLGSAKDMSIDWIKSNDCVFVSIDPNTIHDFPMRTTMPDELTSRAWMTTMFLTLGCNVGGLLRKSPEERLAWYDILDSLKDNILDHTDLMLAAIDRDPARWAYAITCPAGLGKTYRKQSDWRGKVQKSTVSAFNEISLNMRIEWWKQEPVAFTELEELLFKTKAERDNKLW